MAAPSTPITRPFSDSYLLAYSHEHVAYEIDMFFWLPELCGSSSLRLSAASAADTTRLNNVLIEGFVVHLRNVIDFLYLEKPKPTDVVAADFLRTGVWDSLRPAISSSLEAARTRANKEIAHLTSDRIAGSPPAKAWDFQGLTNELRPLLRLLSANAPSSRLSPNLAAAIR